MKLRGDANDPTTIELLGKSTEVENGRNGVDLKRNGVAQTELADLNPLKGSVGRIANR